MHVGFSDHPFTEEKIKNGTLLHGQLRNVATALIGLDIDQPTIHKYISATQDDKVHFADITKAYPDAAKNMQPDIVLISEVIEHLREPYQAVDVLYHSFSHGTDVLITVPNYTSLDSIAASLNNKESIHPHHHWYFSPFTLQQLFNKERFTLQAMHFGMYDQPGNKINGMLKEFPFTGDCIMAIFKINKPS